MSTLYADTDPHIEDLQIKFLRETPVWRKLEMMAELNASARLLALSGLRQRHPHASESELRWRLAALLYGENLARKVYGDLEDAAAVIPHSEDQFPSSL